MAPTTVRLILSKGPKRTTTGDVTTVNINMRRMNFTHPLLKKEPIYSAPYLCMHFLWSGNVSYTTFESYPP